MNFFLSEQTALNRIAYAQGAAATFLPAYCNRFCGKATPRWNTERGGLVEPYEPHTPLGIVHLAGKGIKVRRRRLEMPLADSVETGMTVAEACRLAETRKPGKEWALAGERL
jgi:hypothetical protein